ncbi:uncharacterized protein [Elaeis guineensis]|uniref:Uncharacterized protein LOC105050076 n=1 Tax=Elaeis guineensis var. tenera TaxID=51953 RepID=A0A6I9RKS3_ELAGV|nr:uncharacterized protein LOC105050076 [Elaeis guineensis]
MEEAEKILALKKTYVEIILNSAKESAARILASERKALGFQQSLVATKEEAVSMLLRLKGIMDSKIREAEMQSSGQARRIQELEVQLHEAEDTIYSLRTELKKVNAELEQTKNNLAEPLIRQKTNAHATSDDDQCQEDKLSSDSKLYPQLGPEDISAIDAKNATLNQTADDHDYSIGNAAKADPLKDLSGGNRCTSNPDLACIIMRSKEPELYRNGCTQRIRAFEQNLLDVKVPCGQSNDQVSKNDLKFYEDEKARRSHAADSAKSAKMVDQEKNPTKSGELKFFRRLSPRRKRTKYVYVRTTSFGTSSDQGITGHKPSDNMTTSDENLLKAVNEKTSQESNGCFRSSEDTNLCAGKSFKIETPGLLPCTKRTSTRKSVTKESHLDTEDETLKGSESSTNDVMHQGSTLQVGGPVSPVLDQSVTAKLDVSVGKTEPKMGNVSTRNPDSKQENAYESNEPPVIKYTFQRKRKRGSSNSKDETILPEKTSSSNRVADNQSALVKPQEPSLAKEAPRSNRRLVQVARQLISLSSKRW